MTRQLNYLALGALLASCSTTGAGRAAAAPRGDNVKTTYHSTTAQQFDATCQAQLHEARERLAALEAFAGEPSRKTVLEPLNELWRVLDAGLNLAGLYRNVHPDAEVRTAANACEQALSQIGTDIGLSRPLYDRVAAVPLEGEDAVTRRYVTNLRRDFRRAGVDKDAPTRAKIRALRDELVQVGQSFDKNIREDVRHIEVESLEGLPQDYIDGHPPGAHGKITISTDYPDYVPFMSYARDDAARRALYTVYRKRGYPQNEAVLHDMLQKRWDLAQLLGYPSWAAYITEDKMIGSAEAAQSFIAKIHNVAQKRARANYDELLARLHRDDPGAKAVGDWQKTYLEERVKAENYAFDAQKARAYFPFAKVRQGLFDVTGKMFGVTYRAADVPVWHPSVRAYEILDNGQVIGRFYLDLHPRADKYKHAAAFPIRSGLRGRQLPEAALVCNFPEGDEALMEHSEVETFFHEFGHLLHHLFASRGEWVGVAGISTEWDFVEAPSQMLEEWTYDSTTLQTFARDTAGKTMPDELIAAMRRARDFGKGLWVTQQMFYADVSLQYHLRNPAGLDSTALMRELQGQHSLFAYVPDTYFQLSFGHLEGYSAIYYTYMWSLVIAKDLFSVFTHDGLLNTDVARRYRDCVLAPGGSKDAAVLVRDFLGRDFSFESFARWLDSDA